MHGIAMHGAPALPAGATLPYANPAAPKGGRLVLGEIGGFDSLNPFILRGRAPWVLRSYAAETLLARNWDEPFALYGLLAESVETPPDRSWVAFRLRPEARFSDGSPVTAEDVIWSFEALGREGHPRYRAAWAAVERIETTGPGEVRITFSEPNRELPLIMGLRPILKRPADPSRFAEPGLTAPITSGPYVAKSWEAGRQVTLARNPDWWAKDLPIVQGLYNFGEIRVEYFRNTDALLAALKTGAVSLMQESDPLRWAEGYDDAPGLARHVIAHGRPSGMEGFVFNTRREIFADRAVRAALAEAFDWTWVNARLYAGALRRIESYWSGSELAFEGAAEGEEAALLAPFAGALPEGTLAEGWRPPAGDGARNRRALRRAARGLEAAGWVLQDGQRRKGEAVLAFEILAATAEQETLAGLWAGALKSLGVSVQIRRVDAAQYEARRREYDFDVLVNRWWLSLSPGTEQWLYFGAEGREQPGTRNYMGVAEPAVDGLIRALLAAEERPRFAAAVRALDRVLSAGVYVVPFGDLPEDRVVAQTGLAKPARAPLYGFRREVWWWEGE